MNFENDVAGTALNYQVLSKAVTSFRACSAPCPQVADDWSAEIEADYAKRHK